MVTLYVPGAKLLRSTPADASSSQTTVIGSNPP